MAQSVKHLTVDFSSGHDLIAHEIDPHISLCFDSAEPAGESLSSSLSLSLSLSLFLKINKLKKKGKST